MVAAALIALAACTRAPAEDALKADLQNLIDANFVPGLLEVAAARRANDFPYVLPGEHVRVRYDATLTLKRDHRFGAWDQINIGTLSLLLDAAPEAMHGIKSAGNTAGDVITVRGRLAYLAAEGALKIDTTPPAPAKHNEHGFVLVDDLEYSLKKNWTDIKESVRGSKTALALDEWGRTRRALAGQAARIDGGFSLATDVEGSAYWRLGRAAERAAFEQKIAFANVTVDGAQEALDFLRSGRVTAAVLRNTEAGLAVAGVPPFAASGPYRLTALAALYPEPVHVVVKEDSPLGSPADLFGKHVGVAGQARVEAVEAEAILRAHAVPLGSLAAPLVQVPASEALDQLEAGAFDALVMTSALPSAELRAFGGRRPVRLLPFDSDAIAFLTSGVANYVAITIPARTYQGQTRPLAAVAAVTMLVSLETVPAAEATGLIDLMLTRVDYLGHGSLTGAMVSRGDAERPMTLPWHPGAVSFFDLAAKN
jgi:TRAP transporter TAXI family solute receptor